MDRFISQHSHLSLFDTNGRVKYKFINGEFIGDIVAPTLDKTDADYSWELTPVRTQGSQIYDITGTAISGGSSAAARLESTGYGYLEGMTGVSGYKGTFFKANITSGATAVNAMTPVSGVYYDVLDGYLTYGGKKYWRGEMFKGVTGTPSLAASGVKVALAIPPALSSTNNDYRNELFKIAHLKDGDEVQESGPQFEGGYLPNDPDWK